MNRQQICLKLLDLTRNRLADALKCQPSDLSDMPLGELINLLFLLRGEANSIGGYGASMGAVHSLVGDLLWKRASEFPKEESAPTEAIN